MSIASLILGLLGCIIVTITKYHLLLTMNPDKYESEIVTFILIIFILSTLAIIFGGCGIAKSK